MRNGFTLIELLITITVVAILSAMTFVAVDGSMEDVRISRSIEEIRRLETAFNLFVIDTGAYPVECRRKNQCRASTDLFLTDLGVEGWSGPYVGKGLYQATHGWGGHIGLERYDFKGDATEEAFLVFDDDAPYGVSAKNTGTIPQAAILEIDQKMDDGNLNTGRFRSDVSGVSTGEGSAVYFLTP